MARHSNASRSSPLPAVVAAWGTLLAPLAVIASPLRGDEVLLRNGNVMRGDAQVRENGDVALSSAMGTWVIAAAQVAEIQRSETVEERVESFLDANPRASAGELFELARWCEGRGSSTLALRLFELVLERDPDHEQARRRLGYQRLEGRWVSRQEWRELTAPPSPSPEELARVELLRWQSAAAREAAATAALERTRLEQALAAGTATQPIVNGLPWGWGGGGAVVVVPGSHAGRPRQDHAGPAPAARPPQRAPAPPPRTEPPRHLRSSIAPP